MKDFVIKLQKDLAHLQKTLKQEGDDLVKKLRTATNKKNLKATGKFSLVLPGELGTPILI